MALPLTLLEPQWHLFQDWLKGDGTLEPQECKVTQINPPFTSPSPTGISENSFSKGITRTPLPGAQQTFNSLVTQIFGDFSRCCSITDCFSLWPKTLYDFHSLKCVQVCFTLLENALFVLEEHVYSVASGVFYHRQLKQVR